MKVSWRMINAFFFNCLNRQPDCDEHNSEFAPKEIALIFVLVSSLNKHSSSPFRTRLVKHLTSERVIWKLWMEVFSQLASMMTKSFPNLKRCMSAWQNCVIALRPSNTAKTEWRSRRSPKRQTSKTRWVYSSGGLSLMQSDVITYLKDEMQKRHSTADIK